MIFGRKLDYSDSAEIFKSEIYQREMLHAFYSGLRSKFFVREAMEAECKTIKEAIIVISSTVARLIELENIHGEEEISLQSDKELYQQPERGTFFVNQLFAIGELDFDGNIAIDNKAAILEPEGAMNIITGSDDMCGKCGQPLSHTRSKGVCPARNRKCYACGAMGHMARYCQSGTSKQKNMSVPSSVSANVGSKKVDKDVAHVVNAFKGFKIRESKRKYLARFVQLSKI